MSYMSEHRNKAQHAHTWRRNTLYKKQYYFRFGNSQLFRVGFGKTYALKYF